MFIWFIIRSSVSLPPLRSDHLAASTRLAKVGRSRGAGAGAPGGRVGRGRNMEGVNGNFADLSLNWIDECERAVSVLDQACRLQLHKLWDPPVAEEDFVKCVLNLAFFSNTIHIRTTSFHTSSLR